MRMFIGLFVVTLCAGGFVMAGETGGDIAIIRRGAEAEVPKFIKILRIDLGSAEPFGDKLFKCLTSSGLKAIGDYNVEHRGQGVLDPFSYGGCTNGSEHYLEFSDAKRSVVGSAVVLHAPSVREMQIAYFDNILKDGSLPMDGKAKWFGVKRDGPGDVFIERVDIDEVTKSYITNKLNVVMLRKNLAISVKTIDPKFDAERLAKLIDDLLLIELAKQATCHELLLNTRRIIGD